MNDKRKTIGLRVPSNPIALALLAELNEPMMSTTLMLPGNDFAESDQLVMLNFCWATECRYFDSKESDLILVPAKCSFIQQCPSASSSNAAFHWKKRHLWRYDRFSAARV